MKFAAARRALPVVVLLTLAVPVHAQESEPTDMAKFFGYLGLIELPKDPIEYRERAPLVVPPSAALVPPSNMNMNQINPDWPMDHDEKRRRAGKIDPRAQADADDIFYTGRKLSVEEMNRKSKKGSVAGTASGADDQFHDPNKARMSPAELGFKGWGVKDSEKPVVFAGEPERSSLTEPPPGYRTPSPNAPYGVVTQSREKFKGQSYMDKGVPDDRRP